MSYGDNLITNPSAETGDTSDWTVFNVTVQEGAGETHYFLLDNTAYMYQTISPETIGDKPDIDFKVTIDFKLVTAQELYDSDVKGWVTIEISYSDGTKGEFRVPCVLGINIEGRDLGSSWLRTEAICKVVYASDNVDIDSILVRIETSSLTDGLEVDQIKIEKNLETIIGELVEDNMVASRSGVSSAEPPIFVFKIQGYLAADSKPCVPLPIPYNIGVGRIYIYVDEAPIGNDIIVDIILADENGENGESIFDNPIYRPTIDNGEHYGQVTNAHFDYQWTQDKVVYPSIIQVGDEETPGAELCIEIRGSRT